MNLCVPDMFTDAPAGSRRAQPLPSWAALMEGFYERAGLSSPVLEELDPAAVPQPYQALLVHSSDMTPTLTRYFGQAMKLQVLNREHQDDSYKREITLWLADGSRPVEYGVIRICLDLLPSAARHGVLQEQRPLGEILQQESIPHRSWPNAFFRLKSDAHAGGALGSPRHGFLYGRRNLLFDDSRRLLADVIEVLAPVSKCEAGKENHHQFLSVWQVTKSPV
jgi:chorismate-pyruvate lyase